MVVVERHQENGEVPSHVLGHGYGPLDMEYYSAPPDIGGGRGHARRHSSADPAVWVYNGRNNGRNHIKTKCQKAL